MTHAREKNFVRSLIEIMSGKIYDDIAVRPTPSNALNLFAKLFLHSVRQKQNYADINTKFLEGGACTIA
jgi:hypothetical protein